MFKAPVNVLKLYGSSATYDSTEKTYFFTKLSSISSTTFKWMRVRAIDFAMSNLLFDNETLANTNTVAPNNVLSGDYDSITLPAILQTLFSATAVAIPVSTNVISLTFAAAVTLNISQWSPRARALLGSGDADISLPGAGTIPFPFACNLGGDLEYSFEFSERICDSNPVVTEFDETITPKKPGDPKFVFTVPGNGNMLDFVYYRPENYIMKAPTSNLQSFTVLIRDKWNNVLDMRGGDFYIQLEFYTDDCF